MLTSKISQAYVYIKHQGTPPLPLAYGLKHQALCFDLVSNILSMNVFLFYSTFGYHGT